MYVRYVKYVCYECVRVMYDMYKVVRQNRAVCACAQNKEVIKISRRSFFRDLCGDRGGKIVMAVTAFCWRLRMPRMHVMHVTYVCVLCYFVYVCCALLSYAILSYVHTLCLCKLCMNVCCVCMLCTRVQYN